MLNRFNELYSQIIKENTDEENGWPLFKFYNKEDDSEWSINAKDKETALEELKKEKGSNADKYELQEDNIAEEDVGKQLYLFRNKEDGTEWRKWAETEEIALDMLKAEKGDDADNYELVSQSGTWDSGPSDFDNVNDDDEEYTPGTTYRRNAVRSGYKARYGKMRADNETLNSPADPSKCGNKNHSIFNFT